MHLEMSDGVGTETKAIITAPNRIFILQCKFEQNKLDSLTVI